MSDPFSYTSFRDKWSGGHRALLIVRPTAPIADRIASGARYERSVRGLDGVPIDPERLHITLFCLGQYDGGLPPHIVARAKVAAAMIAASPFDVTFDRLLSFYHPSGKRPLVLCGGDGLASLQAFRQSLAMSLADASLKQFVTPRITPHVTLLRDRRNVEERAIQPISWTVRDFALVDSLIGKSRYIQLGRWTLH
jgi:2'-5' RNA ligase